VQVAIPEQQRILEAVKTLPISSRGVSRSNCATLQAYTEGTALGEYDRLVTEQRMLTLSENISGEDPRTGASVCRRR